MKTKVSLKYFRNDCQWKECFAFNSTQTPSNLITLTILLTLRLFTQCLTKIRAIKLQKKLKIVLLGNCFRDLFTEV